MAGSTSKVSNSSRSNGAAPPADPARPAAENALGANPVVGMTREDLLDAVSRLLRLLSLNPLTVARHEWRFARELVAILAGRSRIEPAAGDRRFQHAIWQRSGYYRRLMQAYLAWSRSLVDILESIDADDEDMERARFVLNQVLAAAAPVNNPFGNPGFLDNARRTRGLSVVRGLRNLARDLASNGGMPSQVDPRPFQVGRNLANTRGAVVFRNAVCEVIQYVPTTAEVDAIPVVLIPPQINKYYIVDLNEDKSFVRFAVDHGQPMFVLSWRNPTAAQREWGMDTYVSAAKEAIDAVLEITGAPSAKVMAACAGGFTAAVLLAHMVAAGEGDKIACLTLLVTVLDTRARTLLGLFSSDTAINAAILRSSARGVLDGAEMARAFAWLRPEDLVWNFVANNYVMGNDPPAFDVLYWNNDTTRLPARFHADLLNLFRDNPLLRPGSLKLLGTPIDLSQVTCDVFIIAGETDHITPWQACYRSTQLFGGDVRFVLSSSGHIQSIVNPPTNTRARYFTNDDYDQDAGNWLAGAQANKGSWWIPWLDWVRGHGGATAAAPTALGSRNYPPADPAPGRYVFQK